MSQSIEALTKSLLHAARQAGADSADAMAVRGTSVNVDVRGGVLEQAERAEGVDIGPAAVLRQPEVAAGALTPSVCAEAALLAGLRHPAVLHPFQGVA